MNFIELQSGGSSPILINLDMVTTIIPHRNGATIYFVDGETVGVKNPYDEIRSTIETMQRRNGR